MQTKLEVVFLCNHAVSKLLNSNYHVVTLIAGYAGQHYFSFIQIKWARIQLLTLSN